jgi:hypothetical protein
LWVRQGILTATVIVPAITPHALATLVAALKGLVHQPERTPVAPESFPEPNKLKQFLSVAPSLAAEATQPAVENLAAARMV